MGTILHSAVGSSYSNPTLAGATWEPYSTRVHATQEGTPAVLQVPSQEGKAESQTSIPFRAGVCVAQMQVCNQRQYFWQLAIY